MGRPRKQCDCCVVCEEYKRTSQLLLQSSTSRLAVFYCTFNLDFDCLFDRTVWESFWFLGGQIAVNAGLSNIVFEHHISQGYSLLFVLSQLLDLFISKRSFSHSISYNIILENYFGLAHFLVLLKNRYWVRKIKLFPKCHPLTKVSFFLANTLV